MFRSVSWSPQAAQLPVLGIHGHLWFLYPAPPTARSSFPKAFPTLLSRVFGPSGIPAATGSSCSIILQQGMRMEVSLPLHWQVSASLHSQLPAELCLHPGSWAHTGMGQVRQGVGVTLAPGHQGAPEQAGTPWVSGKRMGHGTSTVRETPKHLLCNQRELSVKKHSQMCSRRGGKFN